MTLRNKSVLITGGAGFIGSHLVDRMVKEEPSNLVVVDNFYLGKESNLRDAKRKFSELKIVRMDASDEESMGHLLKKEDVQVVFNLAVIPLPASLIEPCWVYRQNADITLCACELARKGYYRTLIHFSSSEAYGTCEYAPMDEKHPLNPATSYGASKAATDLLVLSYCRSFGIDAAIIRPFNNYGPRQNEGSYAGVIPSTIKRILSGESPLIYGDGEQTRDYIYVTETAEAAVEIYNYGDSRAKVINIARGSEISINKLVGLIAEYMDYNKVAIYENERPGDIRRFIGDIDLARGLINFKPKINLEEGLKLTIEWYKNQLRTREIRK